MGMAYIVMAYIGMGYSGVMLHYKRAGWQYTYKTEDLDQHLL